MAMTARNFAGPAWRGLGAAGDGWGRRRRAGGRRIRAGSRPTTSMAPGAMSSKLELPCHPWWLLHGEEEGGQGRRKEEGEGAGRGGGGRSMGWWLADVGRRRRP